MVHIHTLRAPTLPFFCTQPTAFRRGARGPLLPVAGHTGFEAGPVPALLSPPTREALFLTVCDLGFCSVLLQKSFLTLRERGYFCGPAMSTRDLGVLAKPRRGQKAQEGATRTPQCWLDRESWCNRVPQHTG